MKKSIQLLLLFFLYLCITSCDKPKKRKDFLGVASPDSFLIFNLFISEKDSSWGYTIVQNYPVKDTVFAPSLLGLETDWGSFARNVTLDSVSTVQLLEEKYDMKVGKRAENVYACNEKIFYLKNQEGKRFHLRVRMFNEGVAFRYELLNADTITILEENTQYAFKQPGKTWIQPFGLPTDWGPAYEEFYLNGIPTSTPAPDSSGYSLPALFHVGRSFVLLADGFPSRDYHAVRLHQNCEGGIYKTRFPLQGEGQNTGSTRPRSGPNFISPWRILAISTELGKLVESNLIHHVANSNMLNDVSWVVPGSASWSWWGEHDSPKDYKRLLAYVDLAAEMQWKYCLVDANWDLMQNGGTIQDLIAYAKQKNVGILMWYNSGGPHNNVTERPRDIMYYPETRKAEFEKLASWGVKGVKIDFFQSDKQNVLRLYHDILEDAAQYGIMIVFHGCTAPRGITRTYPHAVSFEAVRGAEQYGWSKEYAIKAAMHNTILPFTRNWVGPMDYTPVTFSDYKGFEHQTTNAHELALSVVFESGMIHWADREWSYRKQSEPVKTLMRSVPASWDDLKFIFGYPGESVILARRKKLDWYVAGINGDSATKTVPLDFAFLDPRNYTLHVYKDGTTSRDIVYEEMDWKPGGKLDVILAPKGGFVIWIQPKP